MISFLQVEHGDLQGLQTPLIEANPCSQNGWQRFSNRDCGGKLNFPYCAIKSCSYVVSVFIDISPSVGTTNPAYSRSPAGSIFCYRKSTIKTSENVVSIKVFWESVKKMISF